MQNDTIKLELLERGFIRIANVFIRNEIAKVNDELNSLIQSWCEGLVTHYDFWSYIDADGRNVLYRIHNLENHLIGIKELILSENFHRLIETVFSDKYQYNSYACIIKMPKKGAKVPWHVDRSTIHNGTIYNFSIYLDRSTKENGCLEVIPRSHLIIDPTQCKDEKCYVEANPGDIVVHDVRIYHGSSVSYSNSMRKSITIEVCSINPLVQPLQSLL